MADRSFVVKVKQISGETPPAETPVAEPPASTPPFENCYSFLTGGIWVDPLFPNPMGTYEVVTEGAITRYTARASVTFPFGTFLLVQEGKVTPGFSQGQVRLRAFSTVYLGDETGPVLAEFVSRGYEAGECP